MAILLSPRVISSTTTIFSLFFNFGEFLMRWNLWNTFS